MLFNIFSDGAGGCFGESTRETKRLYCLIVAETKGREHCKCITQQVAQKRGKHDKLLIITHHLLPHRRALCCMPYFILHLKTICAHRPPELPEPRPSRLPNAYHLRPPIHHPHNTHNNGLQTLRLLPAPPRDNPHPLRRPYRSPHPRRSPLFHHHTRFQCNLQPSPARLQNRAARAKAHVARARRPAGDEGRVSARGHHEAQEAELGREEGCKSEVEQWEGYYGVYSWRRYVFCVRSSVGWRGKIVSWRGTSADVDVFATQDTTCSSIRLCWCVEAEARIVLVLSTIWLEALLIW